MVDQPAVGGEMPASASRSASAGQRRSGRREGRPSANFGTPSTERGAWDNLKDRPHKRAPRTGAPLRSLHGGTHRSTGPQVPRPSQTHHFLRVTREGTLPPVLRPQATNLATGPSPPAPSSRPAASRSLQGAGQLLRAGLLFLTISLDEPAHGRPSGPWLRHSQTT
jgi:hypothetical protein